jgi:RimJ/RimL family protein N-acetyltransferase
VQPILDDGVIVLNAFTLDDADAHLAGEDEEQARRFGWYPARSTLETVRDAIIGWREDWRTDGPTRAFALRLASTGELAGGCELRLQRPGLAHMSYRVFPQHRRRGFASRGVRLLSAYAFASLGVTRLELHVAADNVASRGVAHRAGFTEDGVIDEVGGEASTPRPPMIRYVRLVGPAVGDPRVPPA